MLWKGPSTVFFALILTTSVLGGHSITFESLLSEMTDLEALARFPRPYYTCRQFSSYDRNSTDPNILTTENWFANADWGKFLRVETRNGRYEYVMMDAQGPGAIVRIWSANPDKAGILRIYLDHGEDPVVEIPLEDMLGGEREPYLSPLAGVRAKGWNCYWPIPYAKHCKVTSSGAGFYYHVNYRTYKRGNRVRTYSLDQVEPLAERIVEVRETLARPHPADLDGLPRQSFLATLPPREVFSLDITGPGAIREILCQVEARDLDRALRQCLLEMTFDDQDSPSIRTPLGDFFATAPGINAYVSLPSAVTEDGRMISTWVMPFRSRARLTVANVGEQSVKLAGHLTTGGWEWDKRSMHFHASWRSEYDIPTRPMRDWNYLDIQGKGVFVGDMLHVTNPIQTWWGEGDEKIYVDGERFPSHFGTGTEDYYGYAWCSPELFTHAYHNQSRCDGPGNYGQTCVSRFHVLDNIPFKKSFLFDMEVWHHSETTVSMAATTFWYARPESKTHVREIDQRDLRIQAPPPLPEPKAVEGALEGEELDVVSCTGGQHQNQHSSSWGWSKDHQLWWIDAEPGHVLSLSFSVPMAGTYDLRAVFTKAADYGIMRFSLNGERLGEPMDFYHDGVVATEEISLGKVELLDGKNLLEAQVVGSNPLADPKRHMFGLDYLLLIPEK